MKWKDFKYAFILSGILSSGLNSSAQENDKRPEKEKEQKTLVEAPEIKIDYQLDALDRGTVMAYYSPNTDIFTVNTYGTETFAFQNSLNNSSSTLAHENKHKHDFKVCHDYLQNMSLSQRQMTDRNMEIAANICALLQIREEYINADSDETRDFILNMEDTKQFGYYFDKVRSGEIDPLNNHDLSNELAFIGSETANQWDNNFFESYRNQFQNTTLYHFRTHDYEQLKSSPENYAKARKEILTIGGFDFSKYINEQEHPLQYLVDADSMIEQNKSRQAIEEILFNNDHEYTSIQEHINILNTSRLFGDLECVRSKYMNYKENNQVEFDDRCAHSEIAKEWLKAVKNGKIKPEYTMNDGEFNWISEKISQISAKNYSTDMSEAYMYYIACGHDVLEAAMNITGTRPGYWKILGNILTIGGVNFATCSNLKFPKDATLAKMDEKIKAGVKLNNADFTQGQSDLTNSIIENFMRQGNQNKTKTQKDFEVEYSKNPQYTSDEIESCNIYNFAGSNVLEQRVKEQNNVDNNKERSNNSLPNPTLLKYNNRSR